MRVTFLISILFLFVSCSEAVPEVHFLRAPKVLRESPMPLRTEDALKSSVTNLDYKLEISISKEDQSSELVSSRGFRLIFNQESEN
ncbi:hypothetical protein BDW_09870 [Bdellovibrio bacteriovorus W]|nr:hypothetical protein BDW_09870 [Bdellovibrio bacteriovorus W]